MSNIKIDFGLSPVSDQISQIYLPVSRPLTYAEFEGHKHTLCRIYVNHT